MIRLRLTPHGHLLCDAADDPSPVAKAFARASGHGLLRLGAGEIGKPLPPDFVWWRSFAARYLTALCHAGTADVAPPTAADLASLVLTAPMMPGAEYLTPEILRALWQAMAAATRAEAGTDLQAFLKQMNPAWNLVGRVHFNLAENTGDPEAPFAFMATYTARLSAQGRAQHLRLGQALKEYAGTSNRQQLLSLLRPVQRAAELCPWLRPIVDDGDIYHPLRWTPGEAARLLTSVTDLESAGVVVRMPPAWRAGRPGRPKVTAAIGARKPSEVGIAGLLDFSLSVTLEGETLSAAEIKCLLAGTEGLVLLRGQWVEIDRPRLERTLDQFRATEALAQKNGLTFADAMRLLAGAPVTQDAADAPAADWSQVTAGPWLAETLRKLRAPDGTGVDPGPALHGVLRSYQQEGVAWLHLLCGLGLGACLADDMGLGKTIQVLALLLVQRRQTGGGPCLLVAPASLLANWSAEVERFAPDLRAAIIHQSAMTAEDLQAFTPAKAADLELAITSYGTLLRLPALAETAWRLVVLDEAQAIKNPAAKQTRAAKTLKSRARIALTGTPVENSLADLWSIFDFINPGQLGTAKQFRSYVKALSDRAENPYGPLRALVGPYILRRMKTDRAVIADLPDKTEVKAHCHLSRRQAVLYAQAVEDLERTLEDSEGIQRKGLVLAMLMRLKQICNHPSQWLDDGGWNEFDSGKLARLREIAETVAARQEKMLVFTQFREATAPLAAFLADIFGDAGLVLHGGTPVAKRRNLVTRFQDDETVPFFVLSLKAGGSGLTLTAAAHVVHFDRWWNPAVENQATDRAFRIGQKKNVLVHKFICRGTIEEKIDGLIESKRGLSDAMLQAGGELSLTELDDAALLQLVALDLRAAMKD